MRAALFQWCCTGSYLFGAIFCFWLGYWIQRHLVILDNNNVLIVFRESSYQSFSIPIWGVNVIAGMLLLCTLFDCDNAKAALVTFCQFNCSDLVISYMSRFERRIQAEKRF